jgi:NADH:ubiquinone oxidoreductase subunit F (NADH-binding)
MAAITSSASALEHRILPESPIGSLAEYERAGGGKAIQAAVAAGAEAVLGELEASGLRGRGGAGFPTAAKWRTILSFAADPLATSVVVNAAEGEPGTYKDRLLLERNPYAVLEGAMIAAHVVGGRTITIATKASFPQATRVRTAAAEIAGASWNPGFEFRVVEGPHEYLYGEETALLEVIAGRPPFPRLAPPWRRGLIDVTDESTAARGTRDPSGLPAEVTLASDADDNAVPPVLVNNVETFANVAPIVLNGAAWFRSVGTEQTPGTLLCTVTGAVSRPGVYEVPAGTPLSDVLALAEVTNGAAEDDGARSEDDLAVQPSFVLLGVSNSVLTVDQLDSPLSHESFREIGSGLGSASFIVFTDDTDPVAVAAGASRFLAVESCGQCTPCKHDGLEISSILGDLTAGTAPPDALERLDQRIGTVADGARCSLATQHQAVIGSIRRAFPAHFDRRASYGLDPLEPVVLSELLSLGPTHQETDTRFVDKQPDWTYDPTDSGRTPVELATDSRDD